MMVETPACDIQSFAFYENFDTQKLDLKVNWVEGIACNCCKSLEREREMQVRNSNMHAPLGLFSLITFHIKHSCLKLVFLFYVSYNLKYIFYFDA